jgi:D-alanyl-D-alanine carboxypeptidase
VLGRAVDMLPLAGGRVPNDAIGPVWGDGGVASTALDLAHFTEALLVGELVSPPTRRAMVAPSPRRHLASYGLGLISRRTGNAVVAGHDGLYFGWTASTGTDDATGTTVSVVANVASPTIPAARVARAVREALGGPA